mgnify:CR=1 FL=1
MTESKVSANKILNTLPARIFATDRNGFLIYMNSSFSKSLPVDREQNGSLSIYSLGLLSDDAEWVTHLDDVFNGVRVERIIRPRQSIDTADREQIMTLTPINEGREIVAALVGITVFSRHLLVEESGDYCSDKQRLLIPETETWLSNKECEVFFWLLHGFTDNGIAEKTFKSPRTVRYHLDNIREKLGCESKNHVVNHAMKTKLAFKILSLQQFTVQGGSQHGV